MTKVVVFGYHEYGTLGLAELLRAGADVVALVTHEDSPTENLWFRTPAPLARERGIPVCTPEDCNTPGFVAFLEGLAPDLILSLYYRQLICQQTLDLPRLGALNLHGSLLPRYRGRVPVNWVLVNGETETGVTLHHMVRKADAGDIVAQVRVPISFEDTALSLHQKMVEAAGELLRDWLPAVLAGAAPRQPQDHSKATYFGGRKPEDGRMEWNSPALRLYNLVRAVTHPYPGAFTDFRGERLFVWQAYPLNEAERSAAPPGTIVEVTPDGICVATQDGQLRLEVVQRQGEPEQTATQMLHSGLLKVGDTLG